jgi:hypothetical protein
MTSTVTMTGTLSATPTTTATTTTTRVVSCLPTDLTSSKSMKTTKSTVSRTLTPIASQI